MHGFKVRGVLIVVLDFSQEIRDAISHHAAGSHIAIHVQGTGRSKFRGGTKLLIQMDETPIALHTQYQITPSGGLVVGNRYIIRSRNSVRMKFLQQIGSQSKFTRGDLFDPSHFQG